MKSDPLDLVADFLYLGRLVLYNNSDWLAQYKNLWKARRWWSMLGKVVSKTGEMVRAQGMLYKSVV